MATEAVLETLRQLWSVLEQHKVQAAVAGGLALAAWKYSRTTRDVDVILSVDGKTIPTLLESMQRAGFTHKTGEPIDLGETQLLQFSYEPADAFVDVQVDLLLATSAYARETLDRSVALPADVLGFEIRVVACEDLILLKLLSGRIIDQADAVALLRLNSTRLDNDLLTRLAAKLQLSDPMERIRREAKEY